MEAKIIFMASDSLQRPEYLRKRAEANAAIDNRAGGALAGLLLKTAEHRGAGLRHRRTFWLAAGHRRPATLFDERTLLPGADLLEFDQIRDGLGAVLKLVNANRRQGRHEGGADVFLRLLPCGSAGDPTAPSEADDQGRNGTSRSALQETSE